MTAAKPLSDDTHPVLRALANAPVVPGEPTPEELGQLAENRVHEGASGASVSAEVARRASKP